jgi:hypothetical protein
MGFLIILAVIAIVALISLVEAWIIAFIAGLLSIEISFKLIYFVVLVFNLFFSGGSKK